MQDVGAAAVVGGVSYASSGTYAMSSVYDGLLRHPPAPRGGAKRGLGRVHVRERDSGETATLGFHAAGVRLQRLLPLECLQKRWAHRIVVRTGVRTPHLQELSPLVCGGGVLHNLPVVRMICVGTMAPLSEQNSKRLPSFARAGMLLRNNVVLPDRLCGCRNSTTFALPSRLRKGGFEGHGAPSS